MHRLGSQVRADLNEIWRYVVTRSGGEATADRQIDCVTNRFYPLAGHPRLGWARDDDVGRGKRSFPVGDYIIVSRIVGADVQIPRVVHGRRDLAALFGW